jgi:RNA polymerase sigma factor (sigma-70 family)
VTAEELFHAHAEKARDLARKLCHFYAISGALSHMEEAESEAMRGLWWCCSRFNPRRQELQRRTLHDETFWSIMLRYEPPTYDPRDAYKNFWISSIRRIRGSVLDYFRSEKLITKRAKGDTKPTMLYSEKFVSIDRPIGDFVSGGNARSLDRGDTFADMIPSAQRADQNDEVNDQRNQLAKIRKRANLTPQESKVVDLFYHESDYKKAEVAKLLGVTQTNVDRLLEAALAKLKAGVPPKLDQSRSPAKSGTDGQSPAPRLPLPTATPSAPLQLPDASQEQPGTQSGSVSFLVRGMAAGPVDSSVPALILL